MSAIDFNDLMRHVGHKIVCVTYGTKKHPVNVAIECEDCNEVLLDYDKEED
jgi:hypothetical protein